jgi:hypothetical protein
LLEGGRDQAAGALLAGATIKPQLAFVLLAGILFWSLRRRRWGVLRGFAVALGLLCLASTALLPSWPVQMLRATRVTPLPTELWPWVGVTWTLALRTLGLHGWLLGVAYAAVAIPIGVLTLGTAWNPTRPLGDVLALGTIAAFFVSPYAQLYDFPVLVIPLLVLLEDRLSRWAGVVLLTIYIFLPYIHIVYLNYLIKSNRYTIYLDKFIFLWIPALLAGFLLVSGRSWRDRLVMASARRI